MPFDRNCACGSAVCGDQYRRIGEAEKHVYGQNGGTAPNYNINLNAQPPPPAAADPAPLATSPAANAVALQAQTDLTTAYDDAAGVTANGDLPPSRDAQTPDPHPR